MRKLNALTGAKPFFESKLTYALENADLNSAEKAEVRRFFRNDSIAYIANLYAEMAQAYYGAGISAIRRLLEEHNEWAMRFAENPNLGELRQAQLKKSIFSRQQIFRLCDAFQEFRRPALTRADLTRLLVDDVSKSSIINIVDIFSMLDLVDLHRAEWDYRYEYVISRGRIEYWRYEFLKIFSLSEGVEESAFADRVAVQGRLNNRGVAQVSYFPSSRTRMRSAEIQESKRRKAMDPNVLIGLVGSIASIIGLFQQNNAALLDSKSILSEFRERENKNKDSVEKKIGRFVSDEEIKDEAMMLIDIYKTDAIFLDRINNRCIAPYSKAIKDHDLDEADINQARSVAARCVCDNIKLARKDYGGNFPSEKFRELWIQFGCE